MLKKCTKCLKEKENNTVFFRASKSYNFKLFRVCRICENEIAKKWQKNNKKKVQETQKKYKDLHKEQSSFQRTQWVLTHHKEKKESNKRYREKNKIRLKIKRQEKQYQYTARTKVRNALKKHEITKGNCVICNNTKVVGHHPDYSKPLEVIWLCRHHHIQVHLKKIIL